MQGTFSKEQGLSETTLAALYGDIRLLELSRRINWFLVLRLVVAVTLLVAGVGRPFLLPHINVAWWHFLLISGALFGLNYLYWLHYRRVSAQRYDFEQFSRRLSHNIHAQILLDFVILTFLLYLTGGIESPVIYFFLFHVSLSCLFFRRRVSVLYVVAALLLILSVCLGMRLGVIPGRAFIGEIRHGWTSEPTFFYYYLAGVCLIYLTIWHLVSSITRSLRHSEHELQLHVEELVEMHREKTRYMLTTTHELKAPFTAMHSYINVILDGYVGDVSPRIRDILIKMRDRAERLLNMINELLQLANVKKLVQTGSDLEVVDLAVVIPGVLTQLAGIAQRKGITFNTGGMGQGPFLVRGDAEKLQILFTNILSNAILYSHPDSSVEVWFDEREKARRVRVQDHGIGIKKENLEKVFLEHFRAEEAVAMNRNSTGLGLTISKYIIYLHKGRMWLESQEGVGTTVFMEFLKATNP